MPASTNDYQNTALEQIKESFRSYIQERKAIWKLLMISFAIALVTSFGLVGYCIYYRVQVGIPTASGLVTALCAGLAGLVWRFTNRLKQVDEELRALRKESANMAEKEAELQGRIQLHMIASMRDKQQNELRVVFDGAMVQPAEAVKVLRVTENKSAPTPVVPKIGPGAGQRSRPGQGSGRKEAAQQNRAALSETSDAGAVPSDSQAKKTRAQVDNTPVRQARKSPAANGPRPVRQQAELFAPPDEETVKLNAVVKPPPERS